MLASPSIALAIDTSNGQDPFKQLAPFTEKLRLTQVAAHSDGGIPSIRPPPPAQHRQPVHPTPSVRPSSHPFRPSPTLEYQLRASQPPEHRLATSKVARQTSNPTNGLKTPKPTAAVSTNKRYLSKPGTDDELVCSTGSRGGSASRQAAADTHKKNKQRTDSAPVIRPPVPCVVIDLANGLVLRRSFGVASTDRPTADLHRHTAARNGDEGAARALSAGVPSRLTSPVTKASDPTDRLAQRVKRAQSPVHQVKTNSKRNSSSAVHKSKVMRTTDNTTKINPDPQSSVSKSLHRSPTTGTSAKLRGKLEVAARVKDIESKMKAFDNTTPPKKANSGLATSFDFKKKKTTGVAHVQPVTSISEYFGVRSRVRKIKEESIFYSNSNIRLSEDASQIQTVPKSTSNSRSNRLRNKLLKSYGGIFSTDDTGSSSKEAGPFTKPLSKSAVSASLSSSPDHVARSRQPITVFRPNVLKSVVTAARSTSTGARAAPLSKSVQSKQNDPKTASNPTDPTAKASQTLKKVTAAVTKHPIHALKVTAAPANLAGQVRAQLSDGRPSDRDLTGVDDYARRVEAELQAIGHRIDAIIEHSEGIDCSLKLRHSSECYSSSKRLSVNGQEHEGFIEIEEAGSKHNNGHQRPIFETAGHHGNLLSPLGRKEKHRRAGSSQIDSKSLSDDGDHIQESRSKGRNSVSSQKSSVSPAHPNKHQKENSCLSAKEESAEPHNIFKLESPKFSNQAAANIKIVEFSEIGPDSFRSPEKVLLDSDIGWEAKLLAQSAESLERGLSGRSSHEKQMFMTFGLKRSHANLPGQPLHLERAQLTQLSEEPTSSLAGEAAVVSKPKLQSSASQVEWDPYTQSKIDSSANKDYSLEAEGGLAGWSHPPLQTSHSEKVRTFMADPDGNQHNRRPTYQLGEVLDEFVRESEIDEVRKEG